MLYIVNIIRILSMIFICWVLRFYIVFDVISAVMFNALLPLLCFPLLSVDFHSNPVSFPDTLQVLMTDSDAFRLHISRLFELWSRDSLSDIYVYISQQ